MTTVQFIQEVKVKLNRIDSASYEDVRPDEVVFFANEALKSLTLEFDLGVYSPILNIEAILVYLGSLIGIQTELALTSNGVALNANVFKLKSVEVEVTKGSETGWVGTSREMGTNDNSVREDNPFQRSFMDRPAYRFIDDKIQFDAQDFTCNKVRYDYLRYPAVITEGGNVDYTFTNELQDKTVTLILENLEARRLQTQPAVARS